MSKILVTGGAGFIGSHLVDELVDLGHDVTVWDNLHMFENINTYDFNPNAKYAVVDVTKKYIKWNGYHIIHLAALSRLKHCHHDIVQTLEVNYAGTVAMANLAVKKDAHFTHVSSCVVKEPNLNEYAYTKAMAETYIEYMRQQHKGSPWLSFNIARLGNVYGPRQYDTLISTIINKKTSDNYNVPSIRVHGDGKQKRDYIHVDDVVRGLIKIMSYKDVTCDFGHEVLSVNKLVQMFNCTSTFVKVPIPEMYKVKLNKKKTYKTIGWKPSFKMKDYVKLVGDENVNE